MESVSDLILSGFFTFETHLNTIVSPIESTLGPLIKSAYPTATESWTILMESIKSPYADQLPLMNPNHMLFLITAYFSVVMMGKSIMSRIDTKFTIKSYALFHNFVLTVLSAFMCIETLHQAWIGGYSLFGNDLKSPEQGGTGMAKIMAVFYLSKILEFNDTIIMVLKKNFHQITFLHMYHHASIFAIWWLVTFWAPTGEAYYSAALNSFIHVIMYGYYFLSAMGVKQVAVVKKYITTSQMTQFVTMMIQSSYNILDAMVFRPIPTGENDSRYPLALSKLLGVYMVSMLTLFYNFYVHDRKRDAARRAELSKLKQVKSQ